MFKIYTIAPENTWFEWMFSGYEEWGGEQLSKDDAHWMPPFSTKPLEELYKFVKLPEKTRISYSGDYGRMAVLYSYYSVQLKESPEDAFEIELEMVSWHDAPNQIQSMIRCPTNKQLLVEPCINKDYKFRGQWPTEYKEHVLKKTSASKEVYGTFCFDDDETDTN